MGLYRIKVQGSGEHMQLSKKTLIPQLVGPQIYREIRGGHGQVRVCDFIVSKGRPQVIHFSIELQSLTCKPMLIILYRINMPEAPRSITPSLQHLYRIELVQNNNSLYIIEKLPGWY